MRLKSLTTLLALTLYFLLEVASADDSEIKTAQTSVRMLAKKMNEGIVDTIEIIQMPSDVLTYADLKPHDLEEQYFYKIIINFDRSSRYRESFLSALNSLHINQLVSSVDLRWGIIFKSKDGKRIGSIYLSGNGQSGYVEVGTIGPSNLFVSNYVVFDQEAVNWLFFRSSGLHKWLDENFSRALK